MQFTRLRLVGFKSFVEPMEFIIECGLNGVVGPNGCGKSNLVEALRWVMGENSYKNMRGSGMEDVIFSGSASRPARNWAEVTLYLDNKDKSAPVAFSDADELQVSRRIERDKGSIYRINERDVRARDVQLLFADQSTGSRSPSMVGQGRIGELIAAKPQARRALLEEAAGISGLHSRRYEAELRLRGANTNLERLEDVTGELAGRIEALKRQVRQANRFKILSAEIRKNEAGLFYLRWLQAKSDEVAAQSALNQTTLAVAQQAQLQAKAARAQEKTKDSLPSLREEAVRASTTCQHLNLTIKALNEEENRTANRRGELMRLVEQLTRDSAREQSLMAENNAMLHSLDEEEEILKEQIEDFVIEKEERQAFIANLHDQLQKEEAVLQQLTSQIAIAQARFEQERCQLTALMAEKQRLEDEMSRNLSSLQALKAEMTEFDQMDMMQETLHKTQDNRRRLEEESAYLEEAVNLAREDVQSAQVQLSQIQLQASRLQAEKKTLETLLFEENTPGTVALVDAIEVEKGFELSLGSVLGDALLTGIDPEAPLFWHFLPVDDSDPELPAGVPSLQTYVKSPAVLNRRLRQIGVIADEVSEQQATQMQQYLKTGQTLVNRKGALWRWDGLTMRAEAPTPSARHLTQKNRLRELEGLLTEVAQKQEQAQVKQEEKSERLSLCETAYIQTRESLKQAGRLYDNSYATFTSLEKRQLAALTCHQTLTKDLERLQEDLGRLQDRIEETQKLLAEAPDVQNRTDEIEIINARLQDNRHALQQAMTHAQMGTQMQAQSLRRLETIGTERKNWAMRIENARMQIKDLQMRYEKVMAESKDSAANQNDFAKRRQKLLDQIAKAETVRKEKTDLLTQAEKSQTDIEAAARQALEKLGQLREARGRSEERLNAALDRRHDIERQIIETLNMPAPEILKLAQFPDITNLPKMEVLEQILERARTERERLGAVNLQAEEEASEMDARYQAMMAERDDVIEAIKKLRQAIHSLNQEGRERLLTAFEMVNNQFQQLFSHLFGGGMAELQLIESADPLDAGLEIFARPPGKKPQTITLLSGGEQALTATALIFAVFLTNPAPICVLDEVDAPLDDHNVERYCNLLDRMAQLTRTRFVVITHNPITMARMDRLFGVTMAEQGISQLVSVDLHKAALMSDIPQNNF